MPTSAAESALEASSGRNRNSGPMLPFALPITEVLVVAECWQTEPAAEAIIHRAVAAAAEIVKAGLGDIAIAYETPRKEADDEQKPFDHHLSHLAVHGFLHLIGYDHEKDDDAETMESLEAEILAQLGIPDPFADRERMD